MQEITGTTRLFGILADPVHHVQTPQGINALMLATRRDAVMVPMHVRAQDLAAAVMALRHLRNLDGFVVTVPHKSAMTTLCDAVSENARRIGAVNVVRRTPDGRLCGDMLDGEGFVAGLRASAIEPAGCSAYLAGAGGAASAIAFALAAAGVSRLTISNRTRSNAESLVERVRANFPAVSVAVGDADPSGHDLVVNGTSLGLRPGDDLPLDVDRLTRQQIVAEVVMKPAETPLLRAARERGCRIQYGAPMLASQLQMMAAFMSGDAVER